MPGSTETRSIHRSSKVPAATEQQRIVGILDEAFDGIATAKANAEKNLQNARALFESHLQTVFTQRGKGWMEKPLGALRDLQKWDQLHEGQQRRSRSRSSVSKIFKQSYWIPSQDLDTVTIDGRRLANRIF